MILKVENKEYQVKIGSRALLAMQGSVEKLSEGNVDFDVLVDLCYEGIKDKGDLTREQVDNALDDDFNVLRELMEELASLRGLAVEAKKPTAK